MDTPGTRLRQLREMRDLTLQQVADVVGISAQAISQIETGVTKAAKPEHFLKLCAFYDVDPYKVGFGKTKSEVASELRHRPKRTL
jgi:transcriptional regulator with XRE-family HTH domain